MYKDEIKTLLEINNINNAEFEKKLYETLVLGVFEAICKDIKKQGAKLEEKKKFRKSADKIATTKRIVRKYVGCTLTEEGYKWMTDLLIAYFQKEDSRKKYDDAFRQELIDLQNCKCAICKKKIGIKQSHLDHIIPWEYVGDNINNNYQMLCETCNTRKGTATYYEVSMLLLNKG